MTDTPAAILDQLAAFGVVPVIRNSSADLARTAMTWLREAGFETWETHPVPPPMPHWLVTARKPLHL